MNEIPWWLGQLILPTIAGVLSGVGGSVLWEGVIRPRQERRSLVVALRAEISSNVGLVQYYFSKRSGRDRIPEDFHLPTAVFDAAVAKLGELDSSEVHRVAGLYRLFGDLNHKAERYVAKLRHQQSTDGTLSMILFQELQSDRIEFDSALERLLVQTSEFHIGQASTQKIGAYVFSDTKRLSKS